MTEIQFAHFNIQLPDKSSAEFSIFEDLAELFGQEFQTEAVGILKDALKSPDLKPKPNIDYESDFVQVSSKNADAIFTVAKTIYQLTVPEKRTEITEAELDDIYNQLKKWKRPPKQKWEIGDVFSVPLLDGTFSFGQIVGTHSTATSPVLTLFEIKQEKDNITTEELIIARVLSVWNADEEPIVSHQYKILFNEELLVSPEKVKNKKRSGGADLHVLANVYFGLEPYNVMFKENYYDDFWQPNIQRPQHIIWLSDEEREKYRKEKFNINE
ncbi:Immunity protein 26 [Chryseobacterium joostei]|nr:Imm26 family immunity protein [Chryseobacterium joostei]SIS39805.1 Immunity protein 26 [Chryseobacterium joostei]